MAKLTLSIADRDIALAKKLAKLRGLTVSEMFSEWVRTEPQVATKLFNLGPLTRSLLGVMELSDDFDEKDDITDALSEKYGLR